MASSYTSRIRLEKQGSGENANTWGDRLNANVIDLVDSAVAGVETVNLEALSSVTLTTNNGSDDQARNFALNFTGSLNATCTVRIPAEEKIYFVANNTTGSGNIVLAHTGGSTYVTVPEPGNTMLVATTGTSFISQKGIVPSAIKTDVSVDGTITASTAIKIGLDNVATSAALATVSATMATSINTVRGEIPTVNNATITIDGDNGLLVEGTVNGSESFTTNQSGSETINIGLNTSFDGIGTYVFAFGGDTSNPSSRDYVATAPGGILEGSKLIPIGINSNTYNGGNANTGTNHNIGGMSLHADNIQFLSGTWRCMGDGRMNSSTNGVACLWLRIS